MFSAGIILSAMAETSLAASSSFIRGAAKSSNSISTLAPLAAATDSAISLTLLFVNSLVSGEKHLVVPSITACSAIILYAVPALQRPIPTTTVSTGFVFLLWTVQPLLSVRLYKGHQHQDGALIRGLPFLLLLL